MKKLTTFFAVLFVFNVSYGQNEPLQGMFWDNYSYFNPALTAYKYKYQGFVNYRSQWVEANRSPKDFFTNLSMFLDKSRIGIGAVFQREYVGFIEESKFQLNSSYRFNLKNDRFLSLGLGGGFSSKTLDTEGFIFSDSSELTGKIKATLFTGDFGFSYEAPRFMIGLSVKNINDPEGKHPIFNMREYRSFYLFTENKIELSNNFVFKPRTSIRTDLSVFTAEINSVITYKKKYTIGTGYRFAGIDSHTIIGLINWDILEKIRVAYAIEIFNGQLKTFGPSHEAVVGIKLKERTGSSVKKKLRD